MSAISRILCQIEAIKTKGFSARPLARSFARYFIIIIMINVIIVAGVVDYDFTSIILIIFIWLWIVAIRVFASCKRF